MIQTWAADITPLLEKEIYQKYYNMVPQFRRDKADRIRFERDRAQSIGAWVLYQRMRETYEIDDEAVFNLSHSGKYVLCSVEDTGKKQVKLGCDVEMVGTAGEKIARRFFCPAEAGYIMGRPEGEERNQAFCRYWVLKESFMKATRLGMGLDMRSFEIGFDVKDVPVLMKKPVEMARDYYYKEYPELNREARIAVCSTEKIFAEKLHIEML